MAETANGTTLLMDDQAALAEESEWLTGGLAVADFKAAAKFDDDEEDVEEDDIDEDFEDEEFEDEEFEDDVEDLDDEDLDDDDLDDDDL